MKAPARRVFVARDAAWMERVRVYRTDDALEVAHISYFDVSLTRVFFDEVRLVTLHRAYGGRPLWLLIVVTALFGLATLAANSVPGLYYTFLGVTLAFATWTLITALLPRWTVTVFGKRARARMRFPYRAAKARRVYDDLCRQVAEVQGRTAAAAAAASAASAAAAEPWPLAPAAIAPPAVAPPEPPAPGPAAPQVPVEPLASGPAVPLP
jgi:hypothetical protein